MKRLDATAEGEEGHQEGVEKTTGGGGASGVELPSEGRWERLHADGGTGSLDRNSDRSSPADTNTPE